MRGAVSVAMVVYGDIALDSRVQREANSLAQAGYSVTIFCLGGSHASAPMLDSRVDLVIRALDADRAAPESASPFYQAPGGSRVRAVADRIGWVVGYGRNLRAWGRAVTSTSSRFDVWHAHDLAGLVAVAVSRPRGATLVYDVHDLFTETGTGIRLPGPLRWALRLYERLLVRNVDLVVAVNHGVADFIRKQCHPRSIVVVHNCAHLWTPPARRPDLVRQATGIPRAAPVILYHGLLSSNRGLERLCEAILEPGLEDAHVALLGFGQHREQFRDLAGQRRFGGRIHLLDPVPPAELIPWVASADVGAMVFPRATLNLYLSTPNKLFECLAAGVPVVASDFPAMRRIVMDDPLGPLGAVCEPSLVQDVARALRDIVGLDAQAHDELRRRCTSAAHERWNWESEARTLLAAYAGLSDGPEGRPPGRASRLSSTARI
jgi:glycosyltransferase involved in cell wall biosynthesis